MKLIILYPDSDITPLTPQRPFPLLLTGGNTLLGHAINLGQKVASQLIVVTNSPPAMIAEWLAETHPDLTATVVGWTEWLVHLSGELLLYDGTAVTNCEFDQLSTLAADVVRVVDDQTGATGALWIKDGRSLTTIDLSDPFRSLLMPGVAVASQNAIFYYPVTDRDSLFYANKRLLGLGYGSEDVVERSYAEDFTVFPPVFLHETAVVTGCVIGPYVTIDAHVVLENSIVRHTVIGAHARIENAILTDSLIGAHSQVSGRVNSVVIAAQKRIILENKNE